MNSLSFFKRIAQRQKAKDTTSEKDNDLSYEDALLDWKLRRFMQAEYGRAEPPKGIFSKLLTAIISPAGALNTTPGSMLQRLALQFYNVLSKPTATSRLLPGIVAFGLVVMVLSTNSNNIIINTTNHTNIDINPTVLTTENRSEQIITKEQQQQEKREQVIVRGIVPESLYQFYPPANVGFYHPVERHISNPKKHITDTEQPQDSLSSEYLADTKANGF
ncbi:MAG: hypothetical protein ABIQ44_14210 [Chloroflexia bacterium]